MVNMIDEMKYAINCNNYRRVIKNYHKKKLF